MLYENKMAARLRAGEQLSACWIQMGSPVAAELVAEAGFDMAVIDGEHAPIDPINMVSLLQALKGNDIMPMARAPWNDFVAIKRLLDCGLQGIHIPYVNTAAEVKDAVSACKYPPIGIRGIAGSPRACGFGQNKGQYLQRANDNIIVMCAIETTVGVGNLEEMLEVEGLDGIFIGPMDLSTNMGYYAQPRNPEVVKTIEECAKKVVKAGKHLTLPKWQCVSSHTGRVSFASCLNEAGAGLVEIATLMGHRETSTTLRYICKSSVNLSPRALQFFQ